MSQLDQPNRSFGQRFGRNANLLLVLLLLIVAAFVGTLSIDAPRVILLIILYVLTINFSIPAAVGYSGFAPVVAVASLLTLTGQQALIAAAIGIPLAEVMRPVWKPLWQDALRKPLRWWDRMLPAVTLFGGVGAMTALFAPLGTIKLQPLNTVGSLLADFVAVSPEPIILTVTLFSLFTIALFVYWLGARASLLQLASQMMQTGVLTLLISLALAIVVDSAQELTTPAFVLICIGIGTFAIVGWNNWQSRFALSQQLDQFTSLNAIGASLRETLDLSEVLMRTQAQVSKLVKADDFFIALRNDDGTWERPEVDGNQATISQAYVADELTRWVVENGRALDLDGSNMFHAARREISLPTPTPKVWLGVPLAQGGHTFGAMVLQKFNDAEPFSRWSRQVLLSVAGQASAAIENALLYNMTDEALARRVEQLQALLFSISEGVLMLDTMGQIVLVNPTASELIGAALESLRGAQLTTAQAARLGFEPDAIQQLLQSLATENPQAATRSEYVLHSAESHQIFERDESPVTSNNGTLMGWLMVFRDVTEERDRAEWRADLTRMIVHDLRNPITTLSSTMQLMETRLSDEQQATVSDLLANAQHGTANMLEMVDSLMDINRAEAGTFVVDAEAMRLPTLIDAVLDTLRPLALQREVTLTTAYDDALPAVWGDEEILRRVIVNLLDNALKFTPSGGTVAVRAAALPATDSHEAGVQVTVSDDGPGIPEGMQQRIFDRFITFNRGGGQVRGTGLGLSFCKLAVESHEGKIWVTDAKGGGSAFHFTVPGIPNF